jgi:hypothetical protein
VQVGELGTWGHSAACRVSGMHRAGSVGLVA